MKLKRNIIWILPLFLFFQSFTFDSEILPHQEEALLWKIEADQLAQPSFLYGTIHLMPREEFFITEATQKAFDQAEEIVLELDMDDPSLQMAMMQGATMKKGQTLDQLFSNQEYATLNEWVSSSTGASLQMFNNWMPMLIPSLIINQFIEGQPASYELSFVNMAKQAEKEVTGLETVERQFKAMESLSYKEQAEMIRDIIDQPDSARHLYSKMVTLYKDQQINQLYELVKQEMGSKKAHQALLAQRNEEWIPRIIEKAGEKACFFAVGAGHLGGKKGVISLLQQEGYKLTPVF
ncbi:MAG: TraB/GumN family protein [Candidatus Cyclobacteriaceae bacterium M3_2C_046]